MSDNVDNSDVYNLSFISQTQIDLSRHTSDGKLVGSYVISLDGVYEAIKMYHEYLSKQPLNASLKNNSASF